MQEQLATLGPLDAITTALALIYVGLAARNSAWCWIFGAAGCAIWAYLDIVQYQLYSDALLQLFYVGISLLGLYRWRRGGAAEDDLPIQHMTSEEHAWLIGGSLVSGFLLGYFVSQYAEAAATYPDAITTTFSIGATFALLQRRIENWWYWVVIDLAYVGIYGSRGATLFAGLMGLYVVLAIYGYFSWRSILTNEVANIEAAGKPSF